MKVDRLIPAPTVARKLLMAEPVAVVTSTPAKLVPLLSRYATPAPANGPVANSDWGLKDAPFVSVRTYPLPLASL
jgi:hypothetical protein